MDRPKFDMLIELVNEYDDVEKEKIKNAFQYAKNAHQGQKRQSGEDYIIHPLMVACILARMHADSNTICAGLLHDTLEDTKTTKEELISLFNEDITNLVDGVTKFTLVSFNSQEEINCANTRKIITSITSDPRIIIIKLADRLHNMRTLDFKNNEKQLKIAKETMNIFVPLASYIGAYHIKTELEDLSFKFLNPDKYHEILEKKFYFEEQVQENIFEMQLKIHNFLNDKNVPNTMKIRTKNIYGIYKKMQKGYTIYEIHDLIALKIVTKEIDDCYKTLGLVHSIYHPINFKFKDYIASPKTNMYQSLHTTVFGFKNNLVQVQIRTDKMDRLNSYGLTSYWVNNKENAKDIMLDELKSKYQFFKVIEQLDKKCDSNIEFVNLVEKELFSDVIYVYDSNGIVYELAKGSTIIDFALKIDSNLTNIVFGAYVNNNLVGPNYVLNNNDRVYILYNMNKEKENILSLKK